jgi:hypothetical protein
MFPIRIAVNSSLNEQGKLIGWPLHAKICIKILCPCPHFRTGSLECKQISSLGNKIALPLLNCCVLEYPTF